MSIHMNRETAGLNAPTVEILPGSPDQSRPDWLTSFEPIPLLRGGHAQTLAGNYWRRPLFLLPFEPQSVDVDPADGSRVLCHCHWQPETVRADRLTILLVHGLEGSSDSRYIKGITMRAWEAGCNVIRMNMRNCGGTESWTPTLYHSGLSADVYAVLHFFVNLYGLRRVAMAGYSMGGNLVLKLAGELADKPPAWLLAAVGVSPAADLAASADALHEPANRIYEWHFLGNLMKRFQRKAELFPEIYSTHGIGRVRSIVEFDDRITARFSGFTGADDYYFRSSAARVVDRISIPTLVLHALDDPFIRMMPQTREALTLNPATTLIETAHGGHCAFLAKKPTPTKTIPEVPVATFEDSRHWAEETLVRFLLTHAGHPRGG
jgi:predicted alpha/beta-fold hydrolase